MRRLALGFVAMQALACDAVPALSYREAAGDEEASGEAAADDSSLVDAYSLADVADAAIDAVDGPADATDASDVAPEASSDACITMCVAPQECCNKNGMMPMCKMPISCK
jgi:hypothetical protein